MFYYNSLINCIILIINFDFIALKGSESSGDDDSDDDDNFPSTTPDQVNSL